MRLSTGIEEQWRRVSLAIPLISAKKNVLGLPLLCINFGISSGPLKLPQRMKYFVRLERLAVDIRSPDSGIKRAVLRVLKQATVELLGFTRD